jgi:exo-1,4-beta-D-glucosaminidase
MNNAWPSTLWHLYDYYLRPGGAYFATKLACEPVHLIYGYDNGSVTLANDTAVARDGLEAIADVYDLNGKSLHHQTVACASPAGSAVRLFALPSLPNLTPVYFIRLTLRGPGSETIGVNSYWVSTKPDVMGENGGKESWNITPVRSFADYRALETLPAVKLALDDFAVASAGDEEVGHVKVTNTSSAVALLVRLKLTRGNDGEEVLPIRWEDNYFMLLPGESRVVGARYLKADIGTAKPAVSVDCFNNGRRD